MRELSGQNAVPILVLEDGEVIPGSDRIKRWASVRAAQDAASRPAGTVPTDPAGV